MLYYRVKSGAVGNVASTAPALYKPKTHPSHFRSSLTHLQMSQIDTSWISQLQADRQGMTASVSKLQAHRFMDDLTDFLFPIEPMPHHQTAYLHNRLVQLQSQLTELLLPLQTQLLQPAHRLAAAYFGGLGKLYNALKIDAHTILEFDPAATSIQEIVAAYPGFRAIVVYRLAHGLVQLQVPTLPRLLAEYAHNQTGIDIHPAAQIGSAFFIDHGTGVVIGETSIIGHHVKIYQGVTLGALSVQKNMAQTKRHPTIQDHVIIYSGSTILGGETVVGHHSVIGGNTWLTHSVAPYSLVYNKSEVRIRNQQKPDVEALDFVI